MFPASDKGRCDPPRFLGTRQCICIGVVEDDESFQTRSRACLISYLSAVENVEMPLGYSGVPAAARRKRAVEVLGRSWPIKSRL